jgi:DNA-binding transcriptional regulator YiaG
MPKGKIGAAKVEAVPPIPACPAALLARRRVERNHFLSIVMSAEARTYAQDRKYFRSLVELAVKDYGVSRRSLAALLNTSESAVLRWTTGENAPPGYARKEVLLAVADLLRQDLAAEDKNEPRPDDLGPLRDIDGETGRGNG